MSWANRFRYFSFSLFVPRITKDVFFVFFSSIEWSKRPCSSVRIYSTWRRTWRLPCPSCYQSTGKILSYPYPYPLALRLRVYVNETFFKTLNFFQLVRSGLLLVRHQSVRFRIGKTRPEEIVRHREEEDAGIVPHVEEGQIGRGVDLLRR